jgi:hypothetical protein
MKTCLLLLMLVLLAGCATPAKMPASKVEPLKPDQGRVIGSVLLTVPAQKDPSPWGVFKGGKAENFTYELFIQSPSLVQNSFAGNRVVVVAQVAREEPFVMELPAGEYEFHEMRRRGFTEMESRIHKRFTVTAGVTTYAGRMVVEFPERIMWGTLFTIRVDDVQNQTIASLKETYGDVFTNVVKALIR